MLLNIQMNKSKKIRSTLNKIAILLLFFLVYSAYFFNGVAHAGEKNKKQLVLRIAVLDNPNLPERLWMWFQYQRAYLSGVDVATLAAKQQGITVKYKAFFYGSHPLDILKEISKVKKWNPDLILGPHYSNQFLLLRKYFPDTLVLSSYASDPEITKLPDNFYSISSPDELIVKALAEFAEKKFPEKNLHMILQADCKDCEDIGSQFAKNYSQSNKNISISTSEFVGDDIKNINIKKITKGYQKNSIILIEAVNYYLYSHLISKITASLKEPNVVFLTVLDSWGNVNLPKHTVPQNSLAKYEAYRITPLLLDDKSEKKLKQFNQLYFEIYHKKPTYSVSYMTYLSAMSAISALKEFPVQDSHMSMKEQVLASFRKALAFDSNWYRPRKYGIYKQSNETGNQKEILVETTSALSP